HFDTVSVCFSKGLGAPVGSALAGPRAFVVKARKIRKLFGGGMRQAGGLAAAALFAPGKHIERPAEDHPHAKGIAPAIADTPGVRLDPPEVDTNILYFHTDPELATAKEVAAQLKHRGVLVHPTGPHSIRICTHLDVSAAQAEQAAATIRQTVGRLAPARA